MTESKLKERIEYINQMKIWIMENTAANQEKINQLFNDGKCSLINFVDESVLYSDVSPAKYAEIFAVNWGLLDKPEIHFV
jgi:hypothetical protein